MAKVPAQCPNPDCRAEGRVDEQYLGVEVQCKRCGTKFVVGPGDAEAPEASFTPTTVPRRIFVSYSHDDARWFEEGSRYTLIPWIARSLRKDNTEIWYDRGGIDVGDEFRKLIEAEIDRADLALLMISQSFLSSQFIEDVELPRIRARAENGQLIIIPLLLEPCRWEQIDLLSSRQMLPGEPTPLIDYTSSEKEWAHVRFEILSGIQRRLEKLRSSAPRPAAAPAPTAGAPAEAKAPTLPVSGVRGSAAATVEAEAFKAGTYLAVTTLTWQAAATASMDQGIRSVLNWKMRLLDDSLQRLGMDFPLTGMWPDMSAPIGSSVIGMFGAQPPAVNAAFGVGLDLWNFRILVSDVYVTADPNMQRTFWGILAPNTIPHGATNASAIPLPPEMIGELLALDVPVMPAPDPSAAAKLKLDTFGLVDRMVAYLEANGTPLTQRGELVDRTTPYFDQALGATPQMDRTETVESLAYMVGNMMATVTLAWLPRAQQTAITKQTVSANLRRLDQYLQLLGIPFPLSGGWPDMGTVLGGALITNFAMRPIWTNASFGIGLGLNNFMTLVGEAYGSNDPARRAQLWTMGVDASITGALTNATEIPLSLDVCRDLASLRLLAPVEFDPAAGAQLRSRVQGIEKRVLAELRALGLPIDGGRPTTDRVTAYVQQALAGV